MNRSTAMGMSVGLLVIGVLVGVLGTHLYYANLLKRPGHPGAFRARYIANILERELDLTADQRRRIDEIREQRHTEGEAMRNEFSPRVKAHIQATHDLIREVLTGEQRARLEELHRQHPRGWEHFMLGSGVRPRHRPPQRRRGAG